MDAMSKPPPQLYISRGGVFHGRRTPLTAAVSLSALGKKRTPAALEKKQATDERTNEQTDRWTTSSRKAPGFVAGSLK